MTTFCWDELSMEITEGPAENTEGWDLVKEYPNGVKWFQTDRHNALEVEATCEAEAHMKFALVSEVYVEATRLRI